MERSELSLNIGFSANLYPIWQAASLLAPQVCKPHAKQVAKFQLAVPLPDKHIDFMGRVCSSVG